MIRCADIDVLAGTCVTAANVAYDIVLRFYEDKNCDVDVKIN